MFQQLIELRQHSLLGITTVVAGCCVEAVSRVETLRNFTHTWYSTVVGTRYVHSPLQGSRLESARPEDLGGAVLSC